MIDLSPYYSGLRSAGAIVGTVGVTLGVISASDAQGFAQGLNDISEGVKLIMKGGGTILMIGLPLYGALKMRLSSKVADVKIAAPAELAVAMTKVSPTEMIVAVKDLPTVQGVVTTNDAAGRSVASSIPSAAVAAAGTADAKVIATGATS